MPSEMDDPVDFCGATVRLDRCVGSMTLKITGRRRFAVRAWLAVRVFTLGALILGTQVDISLADHAD